MDMLSPKLIDLYDPIWPIRSRSPIKPPHYIGNNAQVRHSILTEGCEVLGNVESSVLGNSVIVMEGAVVTNSVLMPGCTVKKNAVVSYSIIGENAVIGDSSIIGSTDVKCEKHSITTCGPETVIACSQAVDAGSMVYSNREATK